MPEAVIHSEAFPGYQIHSTTRGLHIKVTDYHAQPLTLDREKLARFGLRFADDH